LSEIKVDYLCNVTVASLFTFYNILLLVKNKNTLTWVFIISVIFAN
jgi:hypothetical protein